MICPKCGYQRKSKETVPGDQCPSCGVYYAKVPNVPNVPAAPRGTIIYQDAKPFPYGTVILVVIAIAAGIWLAPMVMKGLPGAQTNARGELLSIDGRTPVRQMDLRNVHITMYSLTTCGYCTELRHLFEANSIPFREVFLDTEPQRQQELFAKLEHAGFRGGGIGTPTLDVNGKMMPNNPPIEEILREVALYARKS